MTKKKFLCGLYQTESNPCYLGNKVHHFSNAGALEFKIERKSIAVQGSLAFYADWFKDGDLLFMLGGDIFDIVGSPGEIWNGSDSRDRLIRYMISEYRNQGTQIFERLYGDFCVGVLDSSQKKLVIARDALGVVPLFYRVQGEAVIFAPSMAMILAAGIGQKRICSEKIFGFLQGSELPSYLSCFEDVKRVPASHFCEFDLKGGAVLKRYLHIGSQVLQNSFSFEENAERMEYAFCQAVSERLPKSGLVGAEVSGGLDSSSVFSVARSQLGNRIMPFSGVFSLFPSCDEGAYIDAVCQKWGAEGKKIDVDGLSLVDSLRESVENFRGLLNPANIHISSALIKMAKNSGCSAILNGIDGDNVISHGRHHLIELGLSGNWDEFVRVLVAVAPSYSRYSKHPEASLCYGFGLPPLVRLLKYGHIVDFSRGLKAMSKLKGVSGRFLLKTAVSRLYLQLSGQKEIGSIKASSGVWQGRFPRAAFNEQYLAQISEYTLTDFAFNQPSIEFLTEKEAHLSQFENGVNQHYFEYTWSNSFASGLSTISPFMDRKLLEFCISVPPEQKLQNGFSRAIFRKSMQNYLPENLINRQWKTDLSPSSINKLKNEVIPKFERNLSKGKSNLAQYIDEAYLRRQVVKAGSVATDRAAAIKMWVLFCLDTWLDQELN